MLLVQRQGRCLVGRAWAFPSLREVIEPRVRSVVRCETCVSRGLTLAYLVDHPQLSTQFPRVGVSSIYLVIGSLLVIEIAQDRGGAPAALRRRAFRDVAAGPELCYSRFAHKNSPRSRAMIKAATASAKAMPATAWRSFIACRIAEANRRSKALGRPLHRV
jgi:hypothetical protein